MTQSDSKTGLMESDILPSAIGTDDMTIGFLLLALTAGVWAGFEMGWPKGVGIGIAVVAVGMIVHGWLRRIEWRTAYAATVHARALTADLEG